MGQPIMQPSFAAGEISPQLWSRVDLDKFHEGTAKMLNFFVDYRGGASNRAGTSYVLQSLDSQNPTRLIPFTFSTLQTYCLAFCAGPTATGTISAANPDGSGLIKLTLSSTSGMVTGDTMTVSSVGGTTEANGTWTITVVDSTHVTLDGSSFVHSYTSGGTVSVSRTGHVNTSVTGAADNGAGLIRVLVSSTVGMATGDSATIYNVEGATAANGTWTITVIDSTTIDLQSSSSSGMGVYTGGGQVQCTHTDTYTPTLTNVFSSATGYIRLTVDSTSGLVSGNRVTVSGVTGTTEANGTWPITVVDGTHFDLVGSSFVNEYVSGGTWTANTGRMRVFTQGAPVLNDGVSITGITKASPAVVSYSGTDPSEGDWVYLSSIGGMTSLNTRFAVATNVNASANTFELYDLFGNAIDTTSASSYTSGGTWSSIYTLAVPYQASDLALLKLTQSADVMTFTHTLYQQAELTRTADNAWTYTQLTYQSSVSSPTGLAATPSMTGDSTDYRYVVTAVGSNGVTESQPSTAATASNSKTMSTTVGAHQSLTWNSVSGATQYNVYRQSEVAGGSAATGALYGYVGSSTGTSFVDCNTLPDFTRTPPQGNNPFSGTNWPGATTYFQGRQAFAGTANNPSRLVLSRSGDYLNMDYSSPSRPDDSIDVTLQAQQVNAIKHLVPLSVLLTMTSSGTWRIDTGDTTQVMTPSNIMARPQSYNGVSDVPPIVIDYEVLFVQDLQSTVRAMKYDFLLNTFRSDNELTMLSNHLVFNHRIVEWAWAQQPFRVLWCVRDDGILLSMTYLPAQNLIAWAQHETDGLVKSICSVVEGSENAVYLVVQRLVQGQYVNYIERMASRVFDDVTQAWFVDCGLQYPLTYPSATVTPSATSGVPTITSANIVYGGSGYTAPIATVVDIGASTPQAGGSDAQVTLTVSGGVITAATVVSGGSGYIRPAIQITDATGSGAVITPVVQKPITLSASASVFNAGTDIGKIVRINGGVGKVTAVASGTSATINLTQDLTDTWPAASGTWSMTAPVTTVSGLEHLEGRTVAILANGGVQTQQTVTNGSVTLSHAADAITIGLPYSCQIDTLYLDIPGEQPTVQGKRKKISAVTLRVANTRGLKVGPLGQTAYEIKDRGIIPMGVPEPLYTGDERINIDPNYNRAGQISIIQDYPLPATVLGMMPEVVIGDS